MVACRDDVTRDDVTCVMVTAWLCLLFVSSGLCMCVCVADVSEPEGLRVSSQTDPQADISVQRLCLMKKLNFEPIWLFYPLIVDVAVQICQLFSFDFHFHMVKNSPFVQHDM